MFVEQMMDKARERLVVVDTTAPVRTAAALLSGAKVALIVVRGGDGHMVGVVGKTDIVAQMGRCGGGACEARVDTIMTRDVVHCRPEDALHDVWTVMSERGLLRVPVIDAGGTAIGIVYARDALPNLLAEVESEEQLMRDYVMNVGY